MVPDVEVSRHVDAPGVSVSPRQQGCPLQHSSGVGLDADDCEIVQGIAPRQLLSHSASAPHTFQSCVS